MKRLCSKLTYANVMVTILAFAVLGGGTAVAATHLSANSVGTKQIKTAAVTPSKLSAAAKGVLTGPQGVQGPQGDTGAMGPSGPQGNRGPEGKRGIRGEDGSSAAIDVVTRYGELLELSTSASSSSYAACDPGETVVGGGWSFAANRPDGQDYMLQGNRPSVTEELYGLNIYPAPPDGGTATGWLVAFENNTGTTFGFRSYVLCASP
jgi:hypothetical protein